MKQLVTLCILMIVGLASCSKNDSSGFATDGIQNEWNYVKFTGSNLGECTYDRGEKIYTFSATELTVVDNYTIHDNCTVTYKLEGIYTYEVKMIDDVEYLFVDDVEQGRIRFEDDKLFIDTWVLMDGSIIDDLPTYELVK